MKRTGIVISVLLLVALVSHAYEGEAWSNIHGVSYKQRITDEDLKTYPSWNPLKDACPVSPSKAIGLALAELKKVAPSQNMKDVQLSYVKLRAPSKDFLDKWHYQLNFYLTKDGKKGPWFTVWVRLDEKVPEIIKVDKLAS
jgi:hypothetical protein